MSNKLHLPKWLIPALIIISFLGFLDASYLTISHYKEAELNCTLTDGCGEVTTSKYSEVFGVPVALGGMLYYLTIFILSLHYHTTKSSNTLKLIPPLTVAGLLASAWFVFVMAFLLKAWCQYCLVSATTSTILFVLGMITWHKTKNYS